MNVMSSDISIAIKYQRMVCCISLYLYLMSTIPFLALHKWVIEGHSPTRATEHHKSLPFDKIPMLQFIAKPVKKGIENKLL